MLVVVFHTSIAYGAAGSWILEDVDKSEMTISVILLTIFTAVNQAYFMGLFFFLSSYFIPSSYDRKGPVLFLKDRLVRLGIPLAFYYFAIGPVTAWYARNRDVMGLGEYYRKYVWSFDSTFFGPAWFLEASIYFAILYVLYRLIARRPEEGRTPVPFPGTPKLLVTAVLLGLIAFAVRLAYPTGTGPLELQLGYFPSYILLFIVGIAAYRNGWLFNVPPRLRTVWKWIGIGAIPILPVGLIAMGALDTGISVDGGANPQAFLYAMWEPFVCIGLVITLITWFQRRFADAGPFRKWLSAHAYTVFLIHPPIVVGWTIAFHGVPLPPMVKWVLVSALAVAVCFGAAGLIRMIPGARKML